MRRDSLADLTYLHTVASEASAPSSSHRRCHILLAVWRCFLRFAVSSSIRRPISGSWGSSLEERVGTATGGSGEKSSFLRYL
ncbi:MAG: hypothetical protein LKE37_08830 [Atopobiaceae bacterium]|nr:hypothetical protein [Atopobiaceae bacterium]